MEALLDTIITQGNPMLELTDAIRPKYFHSLSILLAIASPMEPFVRQTSRQYAGKTPRKQFIDYCRINLHFDATPHLHYLQTRIKHKTGDYASRMYYNVFNLYAPYMFAIAQVQYDEQCDCSTSMQMLEHAIQAVEAGIVPWHCKPERIVANERLCKNNLVNMLQMHKSNGNDFIALENLAKDYLQDIYAYNGFADSNYDELFNEMAKQSG